MSQTPDGATAPLLHIDDDGLLTRVERLSPAELDRLPFGVIRLDGDGKVCFFSKTEAEQSGYGDRRAIGRHFFTQMAPCLATHERLEQLEQARRDGTLDVTFEQIGDFDDAERELRVRIASAAGGGLWLFLERP